MTEPTANDVADEEDVFEDMKEFDVMEREHAEVSVSVPVVVENINVEFVNNEPMIHVEELEDVLVKMFKEVGELCCSFDRGPNWSRELDIPDIYKKHKMSWPILRQDIDCDIDVDTVDRSAKISTYCLRSDGEPMHQYRWHELLTDEGDWIDVFDKNRKGTVRLEKPPDEIPME